MMSCSIDVVVTLLVSDDYKINVKRFNSAILARLADAIGVALKVVVHKSSKFKQLSGAEGFSS
jgi:hypothetical protein